jgi:hypothetical protein
VITYKEKWIGKWRLELLKAVFFFLAKNRQNVRLIQISGEKPPVLSKTSRQISLSFNFFWGE